MPMFKLSTLTLLTLFGAIAIASAQTKSPDSARSDDRSEPCGPAMSHDMMGRSMMPSRMSEGMPMMRPMHGPMMKIMFAIADSDGDGAISFEELMAIHKRVFVAVDANKDGKVTPEEMLSFMQDK